LGRRRERGCERWRRRVEIWCGRAIGRVAVFHFCWRAFLIVVGTIYGFFDRLQSVSPRNKSLDPTHTGSDSCGARSHNRKLVIILRPLGIPCAPLPPSRLISLNITRNCFCRGSAQI